jgi:stage V sporulation protein S
MKVKAGTSAKSLAGSISHFLKGDENNPPQNIELNAIGASAVNQAVKAIGISSGFLADYGEVVKTRIGFKSAMINGEEKTIIRLIPEVE